MELKNLTKQELIDKCLALEKQVNNSNTYHLNIISKKDEEIKELNKNIDLLKEKQEFALAEKFKDLEKQITELENKNHILINEKNSILSQADERFKKVMKAYKVTNDLLIKEKDSFERLLNLLQTVTINFAENHDFRFNAFQENNKEED